MPGFALPGRSLSSCNVIDTLEPFPDPGAVKTAVARTVAPGVADHGPTVIFHAALTARIRAPGDAA